MKIVAKTKNAYLINATQREIAAMMGTTEYSDDFRVLRNRNGDFEEGFTFDVEKLARKVHAIKSREDDVARAIKTFRDMADLLEGAWPAFKKLESE